MKPPLLQPRNLPAFPISLSFSPDLTLSRPNIPNFKLFSHPSAVLSRVSFKPRFHNRRRWITHCSLNSPIDSNSANSMAETPPLQQSDSENQWNLVEIRNPNVPPYILSWASRFSWSDRASLLFTFLACMTSAALVSFVAAAVPTLYAMGRAANSFAKLADAAREELPSTMAAIRLSGMEISDLTLELSDLSQEISEGVHKSAQAVQAAEKGILHIGSVARKQTAAMIEERASLPVISLQPVVSGAAKKTSRAFGYATRTLKNMISGGEFTSEKNEDDSVDRLEI